MGKLIFGCGYLGMPVAQRWLAEGDEVFAMTRTAERAAEFAAMGIQPLVGDLTEPETMPQLPAVDTVLFAVGFDRSSERTIHEVYVAGLERALAALDDRLRRFIYISSTGVYGDFGGQWVDETTPCEPIREGGRACLAAERTLAGSRFADRAVVLRCAGIYGPGRIPRMQDLQAGRPIPARGDGWLNLIHVEDAASAVLAATGTCLSRLYLVSDGKPIKRRQFYEELARLSGAPTPQFHVPDENDDSRRARVADRRVDNRRMIGELGLQLAYPSFREGLAAIV